MEKTAIKEHKQKRWKKIPKEKVKFLNIAYKKRANLKG